MDVDRFLPKYYKISEEIKFLIKDGTLKPDMKVPSENEIISKYKVSNTTARKVLLELENEGLVSRVKGKGTFVQGGIVERSVSRILGFTKNMIESGHVPSTKLIETELLPDGYSDCINNKTYTITDPVVRIMRLRFSDDIPMLLEERYISAKLCPGIESQNLEGSLYDIYENNYNHKLTEVRQMIRSVNICDKMKNTFDVAEDISVFLVTGVTFCDNGKMLELERSTYRGDKYNFFVVAK
ncbi:MAG: GntR family transcriptional regulator [Tenericutes bacterium]|nr:GntR family transcriptional regulator [Mycoplasmatota bacterium]